MLAGCCFSSFAAAPKKITNRKNVASDLYGATAEITHADGTVEKVNTLLQGSHADQAAAIFKGTPSSIVITFAQPEQINLIRIYPGNLKYTPYPSGECGIADYKIERYNNGYYHPVVEVKNQPSYKASGASNHDEYCFEHSFKPIKAEKIRITILKSGATGRSASSPKITPEAQRNSFIRSIEVYSSKRSNDQAVRLRSVLNGDFNLRVYRDQSDAKLFLDAKLGKLEADLKIIEEKSQKNIFSKIINIVNGKQFINIPITNIPDGRYIVSISARDKNSPFKGVVRRMLRIDRLDKVAPPQGVINVANMRVFPIDDFHFAKRSNVENIIPEAESIETSKRMGFGDGRQDGRGSYAISRDSEGNFIHRWYEKGNDGKNHIFYSYSKDLKNWQISDKTPTGEPVKLMQSHYAPLPAAAVPRWGIKTPFKDAKIRFYDAAKDGSFDLQEVRVQWFPPTIGNLKKHNLKPWTTYPLIERNGEWLLLTKTPLYVERFDYNEDDLENDIDCNDNFGNQYLSDDGKTMFVGKAGRLRTFAPFSVEYDNIPEAYRIMRIFYTNDGINWKYKYFCPPDEKDPIGMQHYAYAVHRIDKNFYIGFLAAYPCFDQQIYPEICYSRDGLNWNRLENHTPWVKNTPINTWLWGMIFIESHPMPFEHNGEYFLPLGACWSRPHHYYFAKTDSPDFPQILRRRFESQGLVENWKYFKEMGNSWEAMAESMRKTKNNTVGIARFRKDGFIAVKAKNNAELVSRTFEAANCEMLINAKGEFKIELLNADDKVIADANFNGDETAQVITWSNSSSLLPDGTFKIRLLPKAGSELYTLHFVKK